MHKRAAGRRCGPGRAPRQARSRRTQEQLVEALARLLERAEFVDLSVEDIVAEAGLSVGAFYRRFASRQDLLAALLERTRQADERAAGAAQAGVADADLDLGGRIDRIVQMLGGFYVARARLMRAATAARQSGAFRPEAQDLERDRERLQRLGAWLLERRAEIRHPEPELAVRFGLFTCLHALQAMLVMPALPAGITAEVVMRECARQLRVFLMLAGDDRGLARPSPRQT